MAVTIDPGLTFDTFVVGGENRLAREAARTAAESPGSAYNPLFMYSATGLGKTHLLIAIANRSLSIVSPLTMVLAPKAFATCMAIRPMAPGPDMSTRSPGTMRVRSKTACTTQASGSVMAAAVKLTLSGIRCTSVSGTTVKRVNTPLNQ